MNYELFVYGVVFGFPLGVVLTSMYVILTGGGRYE